MSQIENSTIWKDYAETAANARQRRNLGAADRTLCNALIEARKHKELAAALVAEVHELATLYCMDRRYDAAEQIYKNLLEARERILGTEHRDIVDSLEKLAVVVRESDRRSEAMALGYRAMALKSKAMPA